MELKKQYNTDTNNISETDKEYISKLSHKNFNFIPVKYKEWEITAAFSIIDYIYGNGFNNIQPIIKTNEGRIFITDGDSRYILTEEVEGDKLQLNCSENLACCAEILAEFHNAAEGFVQPPGVKIKTNWGKSIDKYRNLFNETRKFKTYLDNAGTLNDFEKYSREQIDEILRRGKESLKIMKSINYLKRLEESMRKKEICINDISVNLAKISKGKIVITKLFNLGYNMVEDDIADLVKLGIEETGDKDIYNYVLDSYSKIRHIERVSKEIIKAYVSFPCSSMKTIVKYTKDKDINKLQKFMKYIERESMTDIMEVK
ncbi:hypothetical protein Q428_00310 [Fervidicella metallireducens AeB]|uniref:Spore coat protein n=1 Tax=Fervidicella metallireducens AeB TaxID=1403537 RepID=A0A017S118_9CLOT|nr:hypothetical protein [Fervidicella metallireducens]EYE89870.1 hypothetical protein Q428_00310 [Fervidicella metallireducens AeB]